MSKNTETQLVPALIQKKIVPKPTKAEIIEALAIRKMQKLEADRQKAEQAFRTAEKTRDEAIVAHLVDEFKAGRISIHDTWLYDTNRVDRNDEVYEIGGRVKVGKIPQNVQRLHDKYEAARGAFNAVRHNPSMTDLKKEIRDQINGSAAYTQGDRVGAMLKDEGMSKALDAMLKKLETPTAKTEPEIAA